MWLKCCVLLLVVLGVAVQGSTDDEFSGIVSALRIAGRLYDDCTKKGSLLTCFKMKAITILDRAGRSEQITLTDYLALVRDNNSGNRAENGRTLTENDLESILSGGSSEAKENKLTSLLIDRIARFFSTHTIKFSLPKFSSGELQRGMEEGRGKMKKMMSMMMMAGAMKMMMLIPIAVITLFMLAGKAFIISKVALVLALLITLKKLLSSKNDHGHEHGWSSGGGHGGWDKRAMSGDNELAHDIAYSAYKPTQ
ncbi:uncharacterized protein LOC142330472 [Lycorma delicatula]|uniref:uncharacterized protein LOC142330472 n=1 Tax=Lycorma delicatula TaxID=130591 RepID=UPI003F519A9D